MRTGRFLVILLLAAANSAVAGDTRVTLTVGSVLASTRDEIVTIPITLANPNDSLAGIEFQIKMEPNYYATFPWDEERAGQNLAGDSSGTLMSGWEWFSVSSLDKTEFDLKVAGMADWPNEKRHLPLRPQEGGVAAYVRVKLSRSMPTTSPIAIRLPADG